NTKRVQSAARRNPEMRRLLPLFLLIVCSLQAQVERLPLYRITLVQAAPGKLLEVIDAYKQQFAALQAAGEEAPLWMRHSQGDHWDLLIIYPMGSYSEYFSAVRLGRRAQVRQVGQSLIAWQEDWFCYGAE